jgi:phytoene dehydrogenase-like protein
MSKDISQIHWDNIVVGAGIGGLALAALLSHHGKKVLVVEKNSWVGGRAATFPGDKIGNENEITKALRGLTLGSFAKPEIRREGLDIGEWNVNTGFHAWVNAKPGTGSIGRLFKHLGMEVKSKSSKKIIYQALDGKIYDLGSLLGQVSFLGLKNALEMLKIISKVNKMDYNDFKQYINVRLKDWLDDTTDSERIKELLTIIACSVTTVPRTELIDASEFLRIFQIFWRNKQNPGHPVDEGIVNLATSLEKAITQHGGMVLVNSPVKKVIVKEKKAVGVETNDGSYHADLVTINVCAQSLFSVLDEALFTKDYVKKLKGIIPTGGVGGYIGLDTRLVQGSNLFWTRNTAGNHSFMGWPDSEFTPCLAPEGKQLLSYGMMASVEELKDPANVQKLNEIAYQKMCDLVEGIEDHWLWRGTAHAMMINGAAQMIGQCADEKPDIKPPGVDNLYLVGDTVSHAAGVGIEVAVDSAIICAEDILHIKIRDD